jgi:hypothetical protein
MVFNIIEISRIPTYSHLFIKLNSVPAFILPNLILFMIPPLVILNLSHVCIEYGNKCDTAFMKMMIVDIKMTFLIDTWYVNIIISLLFSAIYFTVDIMLYIEFLPEWITLSRSYLKTVAQYVSEAKGAAEAADAEDTADDTDAVDAVDAVEAVDTAYTVDPVDAVYTVDTVDNVDAVDNVTAEDTADDIDAKYIIDA